MYAPLFAKLTPEASEKVRKGNYERLFDEATAARAGVGAGQREGEQLTPAPLARHRGRTDS